MTLQERMLAEKEMLEKEKMELVNKLANAPAGTLVFHKSGKSYKFYREFPPLVPGLSPVRKYIKKNEHELLYALAEKKVNRKRHAELQKRLLAIDQFLHNNFSEYDTSYKRMKQCDFFRNYFNLGDTALADELKTWQESKYKKNTEHPEQLIIPAAGGIMVRSKSEAFIAFALSEHNIPFRYECALDIGNRSIYPDFTIMHPYTGHRIIWEHFGLMDDPEYVRKTAYKLKTYIENGFIPNKTLFMTFESSSDPFDFEKVLFIIEKMIL